MKIAEPLSKGLRVVSFCAFVCVVMIHSQAMPTTVDNTLSCRLYAYIFTKLTRWAVPWFFLISGFFVNRSFERIKMLDDWIAFGKKKVMSLVVPYILWSLIISFCLMPIILAANYRAGRAILCNTPFDEGFLSYNAFMGMFGINREGGPKVAGHLWFLRTLIIMTAMCPLAFIIRRHLAKLRNVLTMIMGG